MVCGSGEHHVSEHTIYRKGKRVVIKGHCAKNPRKHRVGAHISHNGVTGKREHVEGYVAE